MSFLKWLFESAIGNILVALIFVAFVGQFFLIPSSSMEKTLMTGDFLFASKLKYGAPIPKIPILGQRILPDFFKNDHLLIWNHPKRGEIVIFSSPTQDNIALIKRCVAIEGDIIFFKNKIQYIHFANTPDFIDNKTPKHYINNILFYENPYSTPFGAHNDADVTSITKDTPPQTFTFPNSNHKNTIKLSFNNDIVLAIKIGQGNYFMTGDNMDHSADSRFFGTITEKHIIAKPKFVFLSFDGWKIRWNRTLKWIK